MIEKGISFGNIHSYHDLNLILSGSDIPPAEPKETYVDIPGADGTVDLTEAVGEVRYNDRTCKFTFTMAPDDAMTWEEKKTEISNLLNGRTAQITLDKDEEYYYIGRCRVDEYLSDKRINQIVITARVRPYKLKQSETILQYPLSITPKPICIQNARKSVSPYIECTNNNTSVKFGLKSFALKAGTNKVLDIVFVKGDNYLTIAGSGTITFRFQEGDL